VSRRTINSIENDRYTPSLPATSRHSAATIAWCDDRLGHDIRLLAAIGIANYRRD
jgi:hypothetical protein